MIREDFERRILHGLCCEWKTKALQLKPSEKMGFQQPLFAIRDLKSKWGYWSSEKREIALSAELVYSHSWGAVREVLLHEMAHQYAAQVLHGRNEPPHGPSFRRACHVLRANPKASAGHPLLDQRLSDDFGCREDRLLSRVKKLMALAQSANRFEAEAAMAKAHELLKSHQLDISPGQKNEEFVSALVGKPALRHSREHYLLSNLLQDFYFVYGVWVPAYALEKARMGTVLEITGRIPNVKTACYVHDFVMRFIEARWKEYAGLRRLDRHRKTDFSVGIIKGFQKRLADGAQARKDLCGGLSLVALKDRELEKQVAYRYPSLRQIRSKPRRIDEKVLQDGMKIGRKLVVHKGIEERTSTEVRKLKDPQIFSRLS
jgi:predicted SprT family Zn-dependent metalloprotease